MDLVLFFRKSLQGIFTLVLSAALLAPLSMSAQDKDALLAAGAGEKLGMDLYRCLATGPGNFVFSPYSISEMLALLSDGAEGKTREELLKALHWGPASDRLSAGFGAQDRQLDLSGQHDVTLLVANGLWYQMGGEPSAAFLQTAQGAYRAEARSADFSTNPASVQQEINGWVGHKTHGKIADLLPPGSIKADTRLALVNAIYFKGKWEHPFEARRTSVRPFFVRGETSAMVSQMNETAELKFLSIPGADLLEMPYKGEGLSMVILLPSETDGLPSLERSLSLDPPHLVEWLASLDFSRPESIRVTLPRFTMSHSLELTETLRQLGVTSAFDRHNADFSPINGNHDLYVSTLLHKAFLDVNEEGTEAAAATYGGMATLGVMRAREFTADHPFLFLIRDNATGSILFLGRVVDPRAD
jgi:serpin B